MIPRGTYKARAVEGALGKTGTGKEQVGVLLCITAGEYEGTTITWYGYFTDKTIERTMEALRVLGWSTDDLSDLAGIDANEVSIVVDHEENDKGEVHARVKWINGGGSIAMKERLEAGAAKAFAARMKGAAIASRQKTSGGRPAATNGTRRPAQALTSGDPGFGDDDIPF